MKTNQIKLGTVLSYLSMALNVIIGIAYTPVMIRLLGKSEYGLYNTVASTISALSVLSLGFNSGYIRYYAKYKLQNAKEAIYKLNGLFLLIFTIIGAIALTCGIFLTNNLELVFDEGLTAAEYEIARVLMGLLTINLSISFPMSVFSTIISANERFVFLKLLGIVKHVASPLVTLPLLLMGFKSVAMVSVTLVISLLVDVVYVFYVLKVLKNKFYFNNFEKGIFASLFMYTSFIAINIIVDQINGNLGKFLLGRFAGTGEVAVFSVGHSLQSYYSMFSTAISGLFAPRIHKIVNETQDNIAEQKKRLTDIFIRVGRIQYMILPLIASGLVFFGKPFIAFWAGDGYEMSYYVALFLILPVTIPLIQNIGIEVQRAQNRHQFRSIVYLGMAVMNLVLEVYLCQIYGAVGASVGTAISLVVANGIVMNIYYHKKCNIDVIAFWENILHMSIALVPTIGCGLVLTYLFDFSSFVSLFFGILVYSAIYCISLWLFGMNSYEKSLIQKPLKKFLKGRV